MSSLPFTKKVALIFASVVLTLLFSLMACGGGKPEPFDIAQPQRRDSEPRVWERNESAVADAVHAILLQRQSADGPGLSVLIQRDGETIYHASKGIADFQRDSVITQFTGFRIASLSKPFTAIAVMQLVEADKIALAERLTTASVVICAAIFSPRQECGEAIYWGAEIIFKVAML